MPHGIFLSAATGQGLDELKERLICQITGGARILSLEIPPAQSELVALLHRKGLILNSKYQDDGTFSATAKIPDNLLHSFEMYANNETQNVRSSVRESWI